MKRKTFAYHGALAPLAEACALVRPSVPCVADLMQTGSRIDALHRKLGIALRHFRLVWTVIANRKRSCILVRDFSTIPLAVVFPLIRWKRSEMLFVVNHNLQWTLGNRTERAAFQRLGRWGCRFLFFEEVPVEQLTEYGIETAQCFALLHPSSETPFRRKRSGGVETVGIVGQFRAEKGIDDLLDVLLPLASRYRVVLGLPNPGDFRRLSRHAGGEGFELLDTASDEGYRTAIAACDVLLLNHPASGYEYRASGLVADAASAQVPVAGRNLPMLRHQIMHPASIGECFDDLSEIPKCIERVSRKLAAGEYDFKTYHAARSAQALAQQLDRICKKATN